jgi:DNA-binding protein YbaB
MILTNDLFDELEKLVTDAKDGNYIKFKEVTVQHSDYETLERLIKNALDLGKLKQKILNKQV